MPRLGQLSAVTLVWNVMTLMNREGKSHPEGKPNENLLG